MSSLDYAHRDLVHALPTSVASVPWVEFCFDSEEPGAAANDAWLGNQIYSILEETGFVTLTWASDDPVVSVPRTILWSRNSEQLRQGDVTEWLLQLECVFAQGSAAVVWSVRCTVLAGRQQDCSRAYYDDHQILRVIEGPRDIGILERAEEIALVTSRLGRRFAVVFPLVFLRLNRQGVLQVHSLRVGASSPLARIQAALSVPLWENRGEGAISLLRFADIECAFGPRAKLAPTSSDMLLGVGTPVSPGTVVGSPCVTDEDIERAHGQGRRAILIANTPQPQHIRSLLACEGAIFGAGAHTSHVAVIARGSAKPCIVGVADLLVHPESGAVRFGASLLPNERSISLDGRAGTVYLGEVATQQDEDHHFGDWGGLVARLKALSPARVYANADDVDGVELSMGIGAEGIGLLRLEHHLTLPQYVDLLSEAVASSLSLNGRTSAWAAALQRSVIWGTTRGATQAVRVGMRHLQVDRSLDGHRSVVRHFEDALVHALMPIFAAAHGAPLTVRLLEIALDELYGGTEDCAQWVPEARRDDAKRAWATWTGEMGVRGIRLAMADPLLGAAQIRSILRAAAGTPGSTPRILIPMVTRVSELQFAKALIEECASELGVAVPAVGAMIETPAAALNADAIAQWCDFIAIGSNDLTQFVHGSGRTTAQVALARLDAYVQTSDVSQWDADLEVTGSLVRTAIASARRVKPTIQVGLCGEWSSDPAAISEFAASLDYVSAPLHRIRQAFLALAKVGPRNE